MGQNSNPICPGDRFDPDRANDGDWINDKPGRPDGRAHAAMTHKSPVSDRELQAVKKHTKGKG